MKYLIISLFGITIFSTANAQIFSTNQQCPTGMRLCSSGGPFITGREYECIGVNVTNQEDCNRREASNTTNSNPSTNCGPSGWDCDLNGKPKTSPTTPFIMPTQPAPTRPQNCYTIINRNGSPWYTPTTCPTTANVFEALWNFITHKRGR